MASGLLGYWPGEWREPTIAVTSMFSSEERVLSSRQYITRKPVGGFDDAVETALSPVDGSNASNEFYYDAPTSPMIVPSRKACVSSSSNTSRAGPVCTKNEETGNADWRTAQPPKELFDVPYGTPLEIESIVIVSVERLQQDLAEELSFHETGVFVRAQEQDKAEEQVPPIEVPSQAGTAELSFSRTPRPYSSGKDATKNFSQQDGPHVSDASDGTASSGDSGYVSGLADTTLPRGRLGRLFHFGSTLRLSRDKLDTFQKTSLHSRSSIASTHECVSCLDEFPFKDLIPLTCHSYCTPCFQALVSTALASENHWPPKCCLNEIPAETLLHHLSAKHRKRYKEVVEERSVPAGERVYCSKNSCTTWIPPKNIQKATSCAACPLCRQKTCTSCRGVYHATGECPRDPGLQATLQLANDQGWRRCYNCKAIVEHNQGCLHITCKCHAQFCYVCGLQWRTCSCSHAQLQPILQAANMRRLAAEAREREAENQRRADQASTRAAEEEAAEMREIFRQIERFEIEEAARLAREEEELRMAAIASRQRHEEERILAVSKTYFDLKNELDFLHSLQRIAMAERYEEERKELWQQDSMRTAMLTRHAMELQLAEAVATAKISDSQFRFDQDYHARLSKEREIEDQYVADLKAYWESRPDGAAKVMEGRDALRKAHVGSYRRWDASKRIKHQQVVDVAKEEVARLRSRHEVERAVAAGNLDGREEQVEAAILADAKWAERVAEVRVQMLESMEIEEYALED